MNNVSVVGNVININICIRASNWQVEKIKCLINTYLIVYLNFEAILDIQCLTSFCAGCRCHSVITTAAV